VHSYQRFERKIEAKKAIPYIIAGAGDYANTPRLMPKIETGVNGQPQVYETKLF
jgi:hypothetical protein